jgi:deoxyribodipyrimidine photo-lyase
VEDVLASTDAMKKLPIDHRVPPVRSRGGSRAARRALHAFVSDRLASYAEDRRHPDVDGSSHLSPYLHFGHISTHEVFSAVMTKERWTTRRLSPRGGGAREGWWGVSDSAEAFLDQLVPWRELAFNAAEWMPRFGTYNAIPTWARATLEQHRADRRPFTYGLRALETASTHDSVWNAVQRQLVRDGWFHGQLRMLWGKKILEWCRSPKTALGHMETLMNRYALDGRDPVSYAGFSWILGMYDRPWPERPIFGTVRCMTSASATRKLRMKRYLSTYGPPSEG